MMLAKLQEVMDQLPVQSINGKDYKPVFRYGTEDDLRKFLKVTRRTGERYYPLVWLETPIEESIETEFKLILATLNRKTDMGNVDRMNWTMKQTLEPLMKNVITAISFSRTFKLTMTPWEKRNFSGSKIFNYVVTPDIWDAIQMDLGIRYNSKCLVKEINF